MSSEQKAMSAAVLNDVYAAGNSDRIPALFHERYVQKPYGFSGHDGVRRHATAWRTAFPDLALELVDQIEEGDGVVNLVVLTGTHDGLLHDHVAPTGRSVAVMAIVLYRFEHGRIVEGVVLFDELALYQQLGVVGTPVWG